jgi:hypothetical protein
MELIDAEIIELRGLLYDLFKMSLLNASQFLAKSTASLTSKNKLWMELSATFVFSLILKKGGHRVSGIGFPCIKEKVESYLRLDRSDLGRLVVEGTDFDTVIFIDGKPKTTYSKIQVVRFTSQDKRGATDFFEFLQRTKLRKYKKDASLYLLINIEDEMHFEYKKLSEMLLKTEVPFSSVFVIGHQGHKHSLKYVGIKIYPKTEGPIPIDFRKLPPG